MSYCRFSSDSFRSDLYCYENSGDVFITHVAAKRHELHDMVMPDLDDKEYLIKYQEFMEKLDKIPLVTIGLPFDGKTFEDETESKMLSRIIELSEIGYNVPDNLLTLAKEETL